MNFEDFKIDIESKLNSLADFELLEFRYEPYSFGSGILAYRIKGINHKFIFDGRENQLTWLISRPHEKYFSANFSKVKTVDGLGVRLEELEKEISS